jgi:hypothetical protein
MIYYHVYGDGTDDCFYYNKEKHILLEYCPECGIVANREQAIALGVALYRRQRRRLWDVTWDGVDIVTGRFVEIYEKYRMNGLTFTQLPKAPNCFLVRCKNIVRHDQTANEDLVLNAVCPTCGRRGGAYRPWPYRMVAEDEARLAPNTFYQSDITFGDRDTQSSLYYATEDIMEAFRAEAGRIFFVRVDENDKRIFIDCGK